MTNEQLIADVYNELREIARQRMAAEGPNTLQPTALVNEAVVKILESSSTLKFEDHRHCVAVMCNAMRQVLIDGARSRSAAKRGGGRQRMPDEFMAELFAAEHGIDTEQIEILHTHMKALAQEHPEASKVIDLYFHAGLNHGNIAELLGVTHVCERRWFTYGMAFLQRRLGDQLK